MNTGAGFYESIEQYRCPNEACDSVIRTECAAANTDPATGIRTIRAYCRHCDRLWQAQFELRGGIWTLRSPVRQITDQRLVDRFKLRIAHVLGEIQARAMTPVRSVH